MYLELWDKTYKYISSNKFANFNIFVSKKILFENSLKKYIAYSFLSKWYDNLNTSPIDILDNMLMNYYISNKNLGESAKKVFDIYIKGLLIIKNFIEKELYK